MVLSLTRLCFLFYPCKYTMSFFQNSLTTDRLSFLLVGEKALDDGEYRQRIGALRFPHTYHRRVNTEHAG